MSSFGRGQQLKMLVYECDFKMARGWYDHGKKELEVVINTKEHNVQLGQTLYFAVEGINSNQQIIPQLSSIRTAEAHDLCRLTERGVELNAKIVFSERSKNKNECFSPDYGWVYINSSFLSCYALNALYNTYIVRDHHPEIESKDRLFSIVTPDQIWKVDDSKKEDDLLAQLRDAELLRYRTEQVHGQRGFGGAAWNQINHFDKNEIWQCKTTPAEEHERLMKQKADSASFFLILSLNSRSIQNKGTAYASHLRGVGVHTTFVHGMAEQLKEGCWYSGVIKWNRKFVKQNEGFFVEKVWRSHDTGLFPAQFNTKKNRVEIEMVVNFTNDLDLPQPQDPNRVIVSNSSVFGVEVLTKLYKQHMDKKCTCVLTYKGSNYRLEGGSRRAEVDWFVEEVKNVLGHAEKESSGWTNSQAPAEVPKSEYWYPDEDDANVNRANFADDGAPPDDDYDRRPLHITNYHDSKKIGEPKPNPPQFTDAPNRTNSIEHPRPMYADEPSNGNGYKYLEKHDNQTPSRGTIYNGTVRHGDRRGGYASNVNGKDIRKIVMAIVTQTFGDGAIAYANETKGILIKNLKIEQGSWIELIVHQLKSPGYGGIEFVADNSTIAPCKAPKHSLLIRGDILFLDSECVMRYTNPVPGGGGYSVYSSDVGAVYSKEMIPCEGSGSISIGEMKSAGVDWHIWIQYCYIEALDSERDLFRWQTVKVRGPKNGVFSSIEDSFDDIEIEKLRHYLAYKSESPEPRPLQGGKNNTRDQMDSPSYRGFTSNFHQPSQSRASEYDDRKDTHVKGNLLPDSLLVEMWSIQEVRDAVERFDPQLSAHIHDIALNALDRKQRDKKQQNANYDYERERQRQTWQGEEGGHGNNSRTPSAMTNGSQTYRTTEDLRRAFHGPPRAGV